MDALQDRFRDKASELLQNSPTLTVAMGCGRTFTIETCYVVGNSDELHCIVKPNPALVEAVQNDAHVAFTVNHGFPKQMLQGVGRAFFLGGLDRHPQVREQTLTKVPEATGFLTTIRNLGVLRILPEYISITDDSNLGLGPRPVYVPDAAQALPDRRRSWQRALGISSWPLMLIPVFVAAVLTGKTSLEVTWWLLGPVCLVALLVHVGTVLLATYVGFRRQSDRSEALGYSRVLREGLLPTPQVRMTGLLCLAVGALLGLFLVGLRGVPLLLMGLLGVTAGLVYAGWPVYLSYRVIEDVFVGVGLGPLALVGAYYALTGTVGASPFLVSLPLGCLATSILHAHHLRTFATDVNAKTRTLAVMLGWERARLLFYTLISLPYALVALLILTGLVSGGAWLTFLSLPLAGRSALLVQRAAVDQPQGLDGIDWQMAQAHLAFGTLLLLGLILG
ncbi:MAG TPA: prenyltransferase [Candidatus Tectomicrobia bacterium]|nr:prenyltransferase [Candidatus Tectomicrobia bacterium]